MRALITGLLLATIAPSSHAQAAGENYGHDFSARADFAALDRNRDGYVGKLEANGDREIAKRFTFFDVDRDARLSEREYVLAKEDNQKRMLRDATITARVKAALLAEKGIPSITISVDTYEGSVQLAGFVRSPEIVSKAGRVTASVNGVRTVNNNIAVK